LLAFASVLGLVETLFMIPLPVPGMRLGLANIAVVIALATLGPSSALMVSLGRVLVVGLATGTLFGPTSAMSLAGALGAWTAMVALASLGGRFSCIGWSVGGSAANVIAQLLVASLLVGTPAPLALLPLSLSLSLPSGVGVGFAARALISRVSRPEVSFVG
jgi:heptaprenyl diphosphate synthase